MAAGLEKRAMAAKRTERRGEIDGRLPPAPLRGRGGQELETKPNFGERESGTMSRFPCVLLRWSVPQPHGVSTLGSLRAGRVSVPRLSSGRPKGGATPNASWHGGVFGSLGLEEIRALSARERGNGQIDLQGRRSARAAPSLSGPSPRRGSCWKTQEGRSCEDLSPGRSPKLGRCGAS